jgi:hypothetical protein
LNHTPHTIYRYRTFSARTVDLLCSDAQYFSKAADFNDPFDCSPVIEVDSELPHLRKIYKKLVAGRVQAETRDALKKAKFDEAGAIDHAAQVAERESLRAIQDVAYHATNPEYADQMAAEVNILRFEIETELQNRYSKGLCCFSEEFDNPLLWSHYGDQHHGICIGYALDRDPKPELKQVRYGGERKITTSLLEKAILENDEAAAATLDADYLLRKAPEWGYEKEWRLIGNVGHQDSPLKLTEIIFGLRCSGAVRHILLKALEGRTSKVEFYEMCNTYGTFKLERNPVDMEYLMHFPNVAMSAYEMFGDASSV